MSKKENSIYVYISYSHYDKEIARSLKEYLKVQGLSVFDDEDVLLGTEWQSYFNQQLLAADVFIPIISANFNNSPYTNREKSLAIFTYDAQQKLQIIPYIIDPNADIPNDIAERLYLVATDNKNEDFEKIKKAIFENASRRRILEKEEEAVKQKAETSLGDYLTKVFDRLESNRKYYRNLGLFAYVMSAVFLLLAVWAAYYMTKQNISGLETAIFVFGSGVMLTCILAALSRMMFILGRSFMVESVRNADRYHAISFGKFYIEAFDNISKQEVKEVLGAWNYDSESNFAKQDAKEIDPNLATFLNSIQSLSPNDKKSGL